MLKHFIPFVAAVYVVAAATFGHPGPRIWIDQSAGTITTSASDNDFAPTTYSPSRLFTTELEELSEIWLSEYPGYEVKRTGANVSPGTSFGFSIAGPLLAFDSAALVYRRADAVFPSSPQMAVVFGSSIVTTASGPVAGVNFLNYEEPEDHSHLTYAMFGDGVTPSDGPPGVYALPLRLTSSSLATSRTYYLLVGNQISVSATAVTAAQQSLAGTLSTSWDATAGGAWETASNWDNGVPNAVGAAAILGDRVTSNTTITLNGFTKTVGRLTFDSTSGYTLAGVALVLADSTSTGTIQVRSGSHFMANPLAISANAMFDISPATSGLELSSVRAMPSTIVTKRGDGVLEVRKLDVQSLVIEAGRVKVTQNGGTLSISHLNSLSIAGAPDAWTAQLQLTNNDLVIDYVGATPIATITNLLRSGRNGGAWNGLGIASSLAGGSLSLGARDDGDKVLVKFTYTGDANLDGQVDIADLAALATAWQTVAPWSGGDFNYDGMVDIADLAALATNWQAGVGAPLEMSFDQALAAVGINVPEPAVVSLLALSVLVRRKRLPPAGIEPARPLPGRGF